MELARRALEAKTLETLKFLLTNELRALVEFDRCSLVSHLGGSSTLLAVNNQPLLDKKSKFYQQVSELAPKLRSMRVPLLLSAGTCPAAVGAEAETDDETERSLKSFMALSESDAVLVVPLNHQDAAIGHLIMEFYGERTVDETQIAELTRLSPFFGAGLTQKWIQESRRWLKPLLPQHAVEGTPGVSRTVRYLAAGAAAVVIIAIALFLIPISATVGGEAEIVPKQPYMAYSIIDGLVDQVMIREGQQVGKGQALAALDPKELDYKVETARTEFDALTEKMMILRSSSEEDPAKLAESRIVELNRNSALLDFNYYRWQRQFLEIKAPVSGIVVTKDVESLKGKLFKAGEVFCEIAAPGEYWAEVYAPEDRIADVQIGQTLRLYLNNEPLRAHILTVKEISPSAEARERLGNIYRVRSPFPEAEKFAKVGMKGIGKIDTVETTLWSMATRRLITFWNRLTLYF
jgi:multidrug resistance efflux pump